MNIEWKNNTVCYADGKQWYNFEGTKGLNIIDVNLYGGNINDIINADDFQLNIPREEDYLRKGELDSEGKYNDAVEVFGLFGIVELSECGFVSRYDVTFVDNGKSIDQGYYTHHHSCCKRELTYNQLMTIGAIKRLLDEQEAVEECNKHKEDVDDHEGKNIKRHKAKQAYDILQSLDYEYDLVEQRWYRKEWV